MPDSNDKPADRQDRTGDNGRDETDAQRIEQLLKSAAPDTSSPDKDFLAALEASTTEAFVESHARNKGNRGSGSEAGEAESGNTDNRTDSGNRIEDVQSATRRAGRSPIDRQDGERTSRMGIYALRGLAAALIGAMAWLGWSFGQSGDDSLGIALDRTAASLTMQLELTEASATFDVFTTPQHIRINRGEGRYEIGNSEQTWLVDEPGRRVATASAAYFTDGQLNLLNFVQSIPASQFELIRTAQPAGGKVTFDGVLCRYYETEIDCAQGKCVVISHVDDRTGLLRQIELLPVAGNDRSIARLNIVEYGGPLDRSLFEFDDRLIPVGRIARVSTVQGQVALRPVMHRRWSSAGTNLSLEIGDQVRTGFRGANAVEFQMSRQRKVLLGPASMAELISADRVRLLSGEMRVTVPEGGSIGIDGPGDQTIQADSTAVFRVVVNDGEQVITRLDEPPRWIAGFDGTSDYDPTGSLLASIDGRNVALSVGYHKVSVDIRDQIARTVIEQSFVNHTDSQLEGVFYFPLPQDASISGFGMWINGELVEADVVEKQRAREIYETILRERRDPGLLEWTGGNIFKARVFPIFAHSEKRIKITYTQVLPRRGNRYVYHYGLQSEMLRQNPLRDLSVNVKVNSAVPLTSIECPTHDTRDSMTANSGLIEFSAQQYTPDRDLEVAIEVDVGAPPVVLTPHRRGDDGYFMMQVTPPASSSGWQMEENRGLTADGDPLEMLIIADTSASMNEQAREQQHKLIAALISMLSIEDRVQVAACDVEPVWLHDNSQGGGDWQCGGVETASAIVSRLEARDSLGWTDLESSFAAILERANEDTQIVYVGDGMVSTYVADGVQFVNRLKQMFAERNNTLHAISVGSSYESIVLKGIGSIGGGSIRQVSGTLTPEIVAGELLSEISRPVLRDMKIEFEGVRTARLYPESLPNLSDGQQQILIGRYLPEGDRQTGTVRITATQGETPVSWSVPVEFENAESGNSFIPRLWARAHLDFLLNQGASQMIQDQIIALSEEFNIITPYTSLLVLESDADRERFGVQRRYRMRDGEQFFAEGRDNANYELVQQQMQRAGNWRLGLQRQMLRYFATLGRNQQIIAEHADPITGMIVISDDIAFGMGGYGGGGGVGGGGGGGFGGGGFQRGFAPRGGQVMFNGSIDSYQSYSYGDDDFLRDSLQAFNAMAVPFGEEEEEWDFSDGEAMDGRVDRFFEIEEKLVEFEREADFRFVQSGQTRNPFGRQQRFNSGGRQQSAGLSVFGEAGKRISTRGIFFQPLAGPSIATPYYPSTRIADLFPGFAWMPERNTEIPADWPDEVRELVSRLLKNSTVEELDAGIRIDESETVFDSRRGLPESRTNRISIIGNDAWLKLESSSGNPTYINVLHEGSRRSIDRARDLGRRRDADETDKNKSPIAGYLSLDGDLVNRADWSSTIEDQQDGRVLLIRTSESGDRIEFLIDTSKSVVVRKTSFNGQGDTTSTVEYGDFVEVAGIWWATTIIGRNENGYKVHQSTRSVATLTAEEVDSAIDEIKPDDSAVLFFDDSPERTLRSAIQAIEDGDETIADLVVKLDWLISGQQWEEATKTLGKIESAAGERRGLKFVQLEYLNDGRQYEQLRRLLFELAETVVESSNGDSDDGGFLARRLSGNAYRLQRQEQVELAGRLRAAFESGLLPESGRLAWLALHAQQLDNNSNTLAALEVRRQLADEQRHDLDAQQRYFNALFNLNRREEGYARIELCLNQGPNSEGLEFENPAASQWTDNEHLRLLRDKTNRLAEDGRHDEIITVCNELFVRADEIEIDSEFYDRLLSSLVFTDQIELVRETVGSWLAEIDELVEQERNDAEGTQSRWSRIESAIQFATGDHGNSGNRLQERWVDPLALVARTASTNDSTIYFTVDILNNGRFSQRDEDAVIRRELAERLRGEADELPVSLVTDLLELSVGQLSEEQLNRLVETLRTRRQNVLENVRQLADELESESTQQKREQLVELKSDLNSLTWLIRNQLVDQAQLAFLRQLIEEALDEAESVRRATDLYNTLSNRGWSAEHELESFVLMPQTITDRDSDSPSVRLQYLNRLLSWSDLMLQKRQTVLMDSVEESEGKSPAEIQLERRNARTTATNEFIEFLSSRENANDTPDWLRQWLRAERHYHQVRQNSNLEEVVLTCRNLLGEQPVFFAHDKSDSAIASSAAMEDQLRQRALLTLLYLGSRRNANEEDRAWVDRYIELGTRIGRSNMVDLNAPGEEGGDSTSENRDELVDAAVARAIEDWKNVAFKWMIATARTDQLVERLEEWAAQDDAVHTWRHALGMLLAERGELESAIRHFELIETDGTLTAGDYTALATWYLVTDQREKYERATLKAFDAREVWQLDDYVRTIANRLSDTSATPDDLDEKVFPAIESMLRRAPDPSSHIGSVNHLYRECKDFRVLAAVADSMIGQSARGIYPHLRSWQMVINEIRDEATADSILERIEILRDRELSQTDLRALDLVESFVERRNATIENQAGPHIENAVSAMKRAFERDWEPGERLLMANLLRELIQVERDEIKQVVVEQLNELLAAEPDPRNEFGDNHRLQIAYSRAVVMFNYQPEDGIVAGLMAELDNFIRINDGIMPEDVQYVASKIVEMHKQLGQCVAAETFLTRLIATATDSNRSWLSDQLTELYLFSIQHGHSTSPGSDSEQYAAVYRYLLRMLDDASSEGERNDGIYKLCRLFDIACRSGMPFEVEAKTDLRRFAFERMPEELALMSERYASAVNRVTNELGESTDSVAAVRFFLDAFERMPAGVRQNRSLQIDSITQQVYLSRNNLPAELDERLLGILISFIRDELSELENRRSSMISRGNSYFLERHADKFLETALEVHEQYRESGAHAQHIASYIGHDLREYDRAIDILSNAYQSELLDIDQTSFYVDMLQDQSRFEESAPLLEKLLEERPSDSNHYVRLMRAFFRTDQQERLIELWQKADEKFYNEKDVDIGSATWLAEACLSNELFEPAVKYVTSLLDFYRENDGEPYQLSAHYQQLAMAHTGLARLEEAIEAATASVVTWGNDTTNRQSALHSLRKVVEGVAAGRFQTDLSGLVAMMDEKAAETGQYNYLLRLEIARALRDKEELTEAITQLELTLELMPDDQEIHQELIDLYLDTKNVTRAAEQTLVLAKLVRRDPEIYADLAAQLGHETLVATYPGGAERAYTSMIEMLPADSEGHATLAEIRESQDRLAEAAMHWKRVAEIRSKEPDGLMELCRVQLEMNQFDEARQTIRTLRESRWADRFDVESLIYDLEYQLKEQIEDEEMKELESNQPDPFSDGDPFGDGSDDGDEDPFSGG
ncbi:MAG: VIT domain-containing protein [Planctomycetota bacterium]